MPAKKAPSKSTEEGRQKGRKEVSEVSQASRTPWRERFAPSLRASRPSRSHAVVGCRTLPCRRFNRSSSWPATASAPTTRVLPRSFSAPASISPSARLLRRRRTPAWEIRCTMPSSSTTTTRSSARSTAGTSMKTNPAAKSRRSTSALSTRPKRRTPRALSAARWSSSAPPKHSHTRATPSRSRLPAPAATKKLKS